MKVNAKGNGIALVGGKQLILCLKGKISQYKLPMPVTSVTEKPDALNKKTQMPNTKNLPGFDVEDFRTGTKRLEKIISRVKLQYKRRMNNFMRDQEEQRQERIHNRRERRARAQERSK